MCTGKRRPDWSQDGPLTRAEMADALAWRAGVLAGYDSLQTAVGGLALEQAKSHAEAHVIWKAVAKGSFGVELQKRGDPKRKPPAKAIPRPPGMPDDHPLVKSGRYV